MPRNFRKASLSRYAMTVDNYGTLIANASGPQVSYNEMLNNYYAYVRGTSSTTGKPAGGSVVVATSSPTMLGPFPGWGFDTTGYTNTGLGAAYQRPDASPQLTVSGTALSTPSNLTFDVWGGTGTLTTAVNGKTTRTLRPLFGRAQ
tara:strand:+ start:108 stop:545 length:438 start_codon:yes stop_codon:yes gene_type:complete